MINNAHRMALTSCTTYSCIIITALLSSIAHQSPTFNNHASATSSLQPLIVQSKLRKNIAIAIAFEQLCDSWEDGELRLYSPSKFMSFELIQTHTELSMVASLPKVGCSNSKIQDDDALLRCRERKRSMKSVIDNRYALATTHVAYVEALRNIGHSIKNFPEVALESSPPLSSTMASELAIMHQKSPSHSPFPSSTSSRSHFALTLSPVKDGPHRNLDSHDNNSPVSNASPLHVNLMRSGVTQPITIKERSPAGERGSMESFSSVP